jgi:hypothetical protein
MAQISIFTVGDKAIDPRLSSQDPDHAVYRAILGRPLATHVSKKMISPPEQRGAKVRKNGRLQAGH